LARNQKKLSADDDGPSEAGYDNPEGTAEPSEHKSVFSEMGAGFAVDDSGGSEPGYGFPEEDYELGKVLREGGIILREVGCCCRDGSLFGNERR